MPMPRRYSEISLRIKLELALNTPSFDLKLRFILKPRFRPIPMPIPMPKMGPRPRLDLGARLKLRSTRTLELTPKLRHLDMFHLAKIGLA